MLSEESHLWHYPPYILINDLSHFYPGATGSETVDAVAN